MFRLRLFCSVIYLLAILMPLCSMNNEPNYKPSTDYSVISNTLSAIDRWEINIFDDNENLLKTISGTSTEKPFPESIEDTIPIASKVLRPKGYSNDAETWVLGDFSKEDSGDGLIWEFYMVPKGGNTFPLKLELSSSYSDCSVKIRALRYRIPDVDKSEDVYESEILEIGNDQAIGYINWNVTMPRGGTYLLEIYLIDPETDKQLEFGAVVIQEKGSESTSATVPMQKIKS